MAPKTASDLRFHFVAGAGFEPATSGRHQGHRDNYGLGPETTDSLGVVRDSPSLPCSEYPSSTEWNGPNLDRRWTPFESSEDPSPEGVGQGLGGAEIALNQVGQPLLPGLGGPVESQKVRMWPGLTVQAAGSSMVDRWLRR
jgi:hypothetical protein